MLLSHDLLKGDMFPELNERPHIERDFLRIVQADGVYYSEIEMPVEGCYSVDEFGDEHIIVNRDLFGLEKLRTQLHEIIHHRFDQPIDKELVKLFRSLGSFETRADIIAEALSLVLIFPFYELERYLITGEIRPELLPYLEERVKIVDDHGI